MDPNAWLEKAERLHCTMARLREAQTAHDEGENLERVVIAHWLCEEFSDGPRAGTATHPRFPTSH
jgi:hypothetical protein